MADPTGAISINPLSAELIVLNALKSLVANADGSFSCYPDIGPENAPRPYLTYIAVGGQSPNHLSNTVALQNARIQVNAWASDRASAIQLIQGAADALTGAPINATSIGAPVSTYEPDTKLYGSRLDFSIWFTP